jgi:hypothetical protein
MVQSARLRKSTQCESYRLQFLQARALWLESVSGGGAIESLGVDQGSAQCWK